MSKIRRGSIRGSFTRTLNELKEELDKGKDADVSIIKRTFRRLEDRFTQLDKIDEIVMQEMLQVDTAQQDMDEEFDLCQEYRDKMNDTTSLVDDICKPEEIGKSMNVTCSESGRSKYKLPKLELIKFNGEPKDWLSFWSQFKGIHDDENLSSEEKFQYLIQATVADSPARRVVASFPPTSENYPKAIHHLKTRFGKDKILVEVYVRDLLKLVTDANNPYENLSTLYDTLATKLRALESLGVTSDKYAAMLYPLVESALSDEVLKTWERIRSRHEDNEDDDQLSQLMKFLQSEVESEVRLKMAKRKASMEDDVYPKSKHQRIVFEQSTATDLLNNTASTIEKCIFCGKAHKSQYCVSARRMTITVKNTKIINARRCFKCLQPNHFKRECKASIKCQTCGKTAHCTVMCAQRDQIISNVAINLRSGTTILQTLLITLEGPGVKHIMRALIDTGSHRSYITKQAADVLGLKEYTTFETAHSLFGGFLTRQVKHTIYKTEISNAETGYKQQVYLLDQGKICGPLPPVQDGPWIKELKEKGIELSDFNSGNEDIDVLLGADTASTLFTGKIYRTKNGPVAFETQLGWTLMGQSIDVGTRSDSTLILHSLHISNSKIQDLWRMDLIGIHDSAEIKNNEEIAESALKYFKENLKRSKDGRYEVALPWIQDHLPVAGNRELSHRRLESSIKKLKLVNKMEDYNKIFLQWLELGIIEKVEETNQNDEQASYLPHHPVFNPKSKTTPIRPVFDASAKSKGLPSLNDCLEKGPNLLELIMILLLQFRMKQYGVIADIEKAFLQISVREEDRNFLRFFWYENGKITSYRHCRVVFGISSSPFLLAATLNNHLDNTSEDFRETAQLLKKATYVDNCVTSVDTKEELLKFMNESTILCKEAQFNLRGWIWNRGKTVTGDVPGVGLTKCGLGTGSNVFQETSHVVSALGLLWDVVEDTLSLDLRKMLNSKEEVITKRNILASTHRIFDPLGFVSPVSIVPKKMLQELFKKKMNWDEPVPEEISNKFKVWIKGIKVLQDMKIPRWTMNQNSLNKSIHVFTDASKSGYAAVAFMRTETENSVNVQLLLAKARVATIKPITIPRLELISCECGANLAENIKNTIDGSDIKWFFWSDSSNALSWIKRKENWQIFVHNRVKKIKGITDVNDWYHIPGNMNPADLPSRGCSAKRLLESRWWEGPDWLKHPEHRWPKSEINCNEEIVMAEKKNTIVTNVVKELTTQRYFQYFSKLRKIIRMIAWMLRWRNYKRNQKGKKELTLEEEERAERCLWRMVQSEVFTSSDMIIKQINAVQDEYGLWRVKTKLLMRPDTEGFRLPVLLPKRHIAVDRLIQQEHLQMNHCDILVLRNSIRERFWILQGRVVIRHHAGSCKRCKRYKGKNCETPPAPLPLNRTRDAAVFEVVGIDLGGPLYLENECKSWFVVFTCAVYRAVHLELVTAISSIEFIQALRRFIARRVRPAVIYTDNGTNFSGTENLLEKLDWEEIMSSSTARRIKWIFNPPSAPWWGGWWERIVGMVKKLLRRILGRALLTYEEMITILCDCEQTINARPLTYLSENPEELIPLTPMMFLNEATSCDVPDLDRIESTSLIERYRYRQTLRQQLRERFRHEYLSMLVHRNNQKGEMTILQVGDVVLVETENRKRVDWPMARVIETYPGIDGVVRSVKLKVVKNNKVIISTRPTKKLYLLEASMQDVQETIGLEKPETKKTEIQTEELTSKLHVPEKMAPEVVTRSGRAVKIPSRLQY